MDEINGRHQRSGQIREPRPMKELTDNEPDIRETMTRSIPDLQAVEHPQQRPHLGDTTSDTRTIGGAALPLVSVIIPAYNAEKYIARTLESVVSQTYKNTEVLVINDGSTDRTVGIVESFVRNDSRIRILHQPNLGATAARNCGLRSSKGEYIAFIDADDVWHNEKIRAQVECFQRSGPSVGLVYSWSVIIDEGDNPLSGIAHEYRGNVLAELIYSNFVGNGSSPLIRRSCFEEVGDFKVHLRAGQDWDMYARIAERYEFQVIPKYHIGYRRTMNSISANYKNQERFMAMVVDSFEKQHPNIPKSLFRLSRSRTYSYLASRCNDQGRYLDSVKYFLRGLVLDPARLLELDYYLSLLKACIRFAAKPIVSSIWGNQLVWGKLHRRVLTLVGRGPAAQYRMGDEDFTRRRPRLYDRIHDRRMARLKGIMTRGRS
jgi:glycosyltransferase involved in cell wall biosynthesis